MERTEPTGAHQALMTDMWRVMDRYASLPAIERTALAAQLVGQLIAQVPPGYSPSQVMAAVSRNIEVGNKQASGAGALVTLNGEQGNG